MTEIKIRTSDRLTFKTCRTKWDFGSQLRQNYEPSGGVKVFEFGSAFHRALEVYYCPETWTHDRDIVEAEAIAAFNKMCRDQKIQVIQNGADTFTVEEDFAERRSLGEGMLRYYFTWAKKRDKFTPVMVEGKFEVPIPVSSGVYKLGLGIYSEDHDGNLTMQDRPIIYQGRFDLLVKDDEGEYWIFDHKTAAQLGQTKWLAVNDQITSYCWAMQHVLGVPIAGFVFNEVAKRAPHPPTELKSGGLSRDKQQNTTYALYRAELIKRGLLDPAANTTTPEYAEFLRFLYDNPKEYVRRTVVRRTPYELESQGRRIFLETIDMLNNPSIYPSPSPMNCNNCWFLQPCVATQDGSDVQYMLDNMFRKRVDA